MAKTRGTKARRRGGNVKQGPITSVGGANRGRRKPPAGRVPKRVSRSRRPRKPKSPSRRPGAVRGEKPQREGMVKALRQLWGGPRRRYGIGACVAVGERQGDQGLLTLAHLAEFRSLPAEQPKTAFLAKAEPLRLARIFSGLAHPDRVRLAKEILAGARTHRDLSLATGLKTGPLYHHVRELERAGLLDSSIRNVHDLTDLGRIVLLVAVVLGTWESENGSAWQSGPIDKR